MNKIKKLLRIVGYGFELVKYFVLYPIAMILYGRRRIYIFAERGTDARDNGYYMYRYFREKHPEIETYYIIAKTSADYEKVAELGNVIDYGSFKHYLLFIASDYMISTHIMGYAPRRDFYTRFADKMHLKGHRIFLQHGVIKDNLTGVYYEKTHVSIFICGAKPEYDYINENFGYHQGEVKYTGLARYDGLHDMKLKNQILCMPTWRMFLKEKPFTEVEQSEYVTRFNSLINHPLLVSRLQEKNIQLIFYPHYEMQPYLSAFKSHSKQVIIADFAHYDVQQLLKESKLLITDYSSIFFDFAYMRKPCVYYQFDEAQFYGKHYEKGYFDYKSMGFGEVSANEDDLVNAIVSYIDNEFQMNSTYRERTDAFFPLYDRRNCERIFDEINKL